MLNRVSNKVKYFTFFLLVIAFGIFSLSEYVLARDRSKVLGISNAKVIEKVELAPTQIPPVVTFQIQTGTDSYTEYVIAHKPGTNIYDYLGMISQAHPEFSFRTEIYSFSDRQNHLLKTVNNITPDLKQQYWSIRLVENDQILNIDQYYPEVGDNLVLSVQKLAT